MVMLWEKCVQYWLVIKVIGFFGQMYGVVLLDVEGKVICLVILWNDICCVVECVELEVMVLELYQVVGNLVMLGFIVLKLLWVCCYELQYFQCIVMVLLFKDYLCYWMIGKKVFDMLDVVGMLWLDVVKCDWFDVLLDKCGLLCS